MTTSSIYDYSAKNKSAYRLPSDFLPQITLDELEQLNLLKTEKPDLPEVSAQDIYHHFENLFSYSHHESTLSQLKMSTKNMRFNQFDAEGLTHIHPTQNDSELQGILQLYFELNSYLSKLLGMDQFFVNSSYERHSLLLSLLLIEAYYADTNSSTRKRSQKRSVALVPASQAKRFEPYCKVAGFQVVPVKDTHGYIDKKDLISKTKPNVAVLIVSDAEGVVQENISEICTYMKQNNSLVWWDIQFGNTFFGLIKPGSCGIDICTLNLHNSLWSLSGDSRFSVRPLGVSKQLASYLPLPRIQYKDSQYNLSYGFRKGIGKVHAYFGNTLGVVSAFNKVRLMGSRGFKEESEHSLVLLHYIKDNLSKKYSLSSPKTALNGLVYTLKKSQPTTSSLIDKLVKANASFRRFISPIYSDNSDKLVLITIPTGETKETVDEFVQHLLLVKK